MIEKKLKSWIFESPSIQPEIFFSNLRAKAKEFGIINEIPEDVYKASEEWLSRFKKRFKLSLKL